jgi:hypothetical protein
MVPQNPRFFSCRISLVLFLLSSALSAADTEYYRHVLFDNSLELMPTITAMAARRLRPHWSWSMANCLSAENSFTLRQTRYS